MAKPSSIHDKPKPDKWYIVDTTRMSVKTKMPFLLRKPFDNRSQVRKAITKFFKDNIRFDFIKGEEAIELGMLILRQQPLIGVYLKKYNYETEDTTWRNKKTYRTRFRRHQRAKNGAYYKRKG